MGSAVRRSIRYRTMLGNPVPYGRGRPAPYAPNGGTRVEPPSSPARGWSAEPDSILLARALDDRDGRRRDGRPVTLIAPGGIGTFFGLRAVLGRQHAEPDRDFGGKLHSHDP